MNPITAQIIDKLHYIEQADPLRLQSVLDFINYLEPRLISHCVTNKDAPIMQGFDSLDDAYASMAMAEEQESEATKWIEALVGYVIA